MKCQEKKIFNTINFDYINQSSKIVLSDFIGCLVSEGLAILSAYVHSNGLDADMVDGKHSAQFADASHNHWGEAWVNYDGPNTALRIHGNIPWNMGVVIAKNTSNGSENGSSIVWKVRKFGSKTLAQQP
ncbi:hypothetical protein JW935_01180 [candidate division KSB1 bacterium]|nr:hypothetical protein [candidate division KSB1 bacterium]